MSEVIDPARVPLAATRLAGFLLAHALWYASDMDQPFAPVALTVSGEGRQLLVFEDDTQHGAIERGKAEYPRWCAETDAWAFAREATWCSLDGSGQSCDAVVVDFWARGMAEVFSLVQGFQRGRGPFRLSEPRLLCVDGALLNANTQRPLLAAIIEGVEDHDAVAPLWPGWAQEAAA